MTDAPTINDPSAVRGPRAKRFTEQPLPAVKQTVVPQPAAPASEPEAADLDRWLPEGFTRKPFGSQVQKLAYPPRPGFHRHWFNDTPGRIARAMEAGYKHVQDRDGKNVARIVGVAQQGGGQNAFLMEVPEQWWRQDQSLKDKARDEIDAKIRRGVIAGTAPGQDGAYLPTNQSGTIGPDIKTHGR